MKAVNYRIFIEFRTFAEKIFYCNYGFQEIDGQIESERKYIERLTVEDFGQSPLGKIRKFLWNLTEYPETSLGARVNIFFLLKKQFITNKLG